MKLNIRVAHVLLLALLLRYSIYGESISDQSHLNSGDDGGTVRFIRLLRANSRHQLERQTESSYFDDFDFSSITKLSVDLHEENLIYTFQRIRKSEKAPSTNCLKASQFFFGEVPSNGTDFVSINILKRYFPDCTAIVTGVINVNEKIYNIVSHDSGYLTYEETSSKSSEPRHDDSRHLRKVDNVAVNRNLKLVSDVKQSIENISEASDYFTQSSKIHQIDIMMVYTRNAMCEVARRKRSCVHSNKNTKLLLASIDLAIEETNTAFEQSGIFATLRLVHTHFAGNFFDEDKYSQEQHLEYLSTENDIIPHIQQLRKEYNADLVSLITDGGTYCGLGYMGPTRDSMFSIVRHQCLNGRHTLSHEIGHNMGCHHDRNSYDNGGDTSSKAFGWLDPKERFSTILGTNCQKKYCPRIQQFSSRTKKYNSMATGDNMNDNASQINYVAEDVSNYFTGNGKFDTFRGKTESCSWLSKISQFKKKKICDYNRGSKFSDAKDVCPYSCISCKDSPSGNFLTLHGKTRSCTWLSNQSLKKKRKECQGELRTAILSCPDTCKGSCTFEKPLPKPTPKPSPRPTRRPTNVPTRKLCDDDPNGTFVCADSFTQNCMWLSHLQNKQEYCEFPHHIQYFCPDTCAGLCDFS